MEAAKGTECLKEWWEVQLPELREYFEKLDSILANVVAVISLSCCEANDLPNPEENQALWNFHSSKDQIGP